MKSNGIKNMRPNFIKPTQKKKRTMKGAGAATKGKSTRGPMC